MWPGLADNDEAASPARVRDNQGLWKRKEREREGGAKKTWNEQSRAKGGERVKV